MVVEPASASDAAVRADHTADRRGSSWERRRQAIARRGGKQRGGEVASSREERRQAVRRRGGKQSGGEEASTQERQAIQASVAAPLLLACFIYPGLANGSQIWLPFDPSSSVQRTFVPCYLPSGIGHCPTTYGKQLQQESGTPLESGRGAVIRTRSRSII